MFEECTADTMGGRGKWMGWRLGLRVCGFLILNEMGKDFVFCSNQRIGEDRTQGLLGKDSP